MVTRRVDNRTNRVKETKKHTPNHARQEQESMSGRFRTCHTTARLVLVDGRQKQHPLFHPIPSHFIHRRPWCVLVEHSTRESHTSSRSRRFPMLRSNAGRLLMSFSRIRSFFPLPTRQNTYTQRFTEHYGRAEQANSEVLYCRNGPI